MNIGFVVNQIKTEEPWYDTTLLTFTAVKMGHDVFVMGAGDLVYTEDGNIGAMAVKAPSKKFRDLESYLAVIQSKEAERVFITSEQLDVLFLRSNPSEDTGSRVWAQTAGVVFGKLAIEKDVLVLNDPYHLMNTLNKMYFQHFPEVVRPRTIITRDADQIRDFYHKEGGKIVLKPLQGSGGQDVFLLDEPTNLNQIVEAIARNGFVIAQEYLPAAKEGDTRVILMNGKVFQVKGKYAAIHRTNKKGDIRSNIHAGGVAVRAQMNDKILELAHIVGPKLKNDGMFMAGLDIVGDKIMELNLFSPGGLWSAEQLEKEKFAQAMIASIENKVAYKKLYKDKIPNAMLATMD
ncbi:MAG TPA: glutathione synthetase [Cyclobacteriaceae bacterium]|nr:glutathione synthetase [Cyclobacteriaceae bacterium]